MTVLMIMNQLWFLVLEIQQLHVHKEFNSNLLKEVVHHYIIISIWRLKWQKQPQNKLNFQKIDCKLKVFNQSNFNRPNHCNNNLWTTKLDKKNLGIGLTIISSRLTSMQAIEIISINLKLFNLNQPTNNRISNKCQLLKWIKYISCSSSKTMEDSTTQTTHNCNKITITIMLIQAGMEDSSQEHLFHTTNNNSNNNSYRISSSMELSLISKCKYLKLHPNYNLKICLNPKHRNLFKTQVQFQTTNNISIIMKIVIRPTN